MFCWQHSEQKKNMLNRIDFQINLCSNFPSHLLVEIDGMCASGWLIWARGQRHLGNLSDENEKKPKTSSPSPRNARQKACSSFCSAAWEPRADVAHLPSNFREKLRKTKQKEKKKEKKKEVRSLHRREGHLVPAALHQRVEWHKSRESHGGENQQWPCQRWQLSGKQSIKAGTTCHLHSFFFCKLLACSWPAFSEQKWSPPFPLIYPHHSEKTFVESCSRVSQLSLC